MSVKDCTASNDGSLGSQYQYCVWSYTEDQFDDDSDSEDAYEWECGYGAYCEAFADDGNCIYVDIEVEESDCYGNNETYTQKVHINCCRSGENCNHENIDISSCTRSTDYEDLYMNYWDCLYNDYDSAAGMLACDDYVDSIGCGELLTLYKKDGQCKCELYGNLYSRVSDATKKILEEEISGDYTWYSQWNDVLGCDINLQCDLAAGGEIVNIISTTTTTSTTTTSTTEGPSNVSSASDKPCYIVLMFAVFLMMYISF